MGNSKCHYEGKLRFMSWAGDVRLNYGSSSSLFEIVFNNNKRYNNHNGMSLIHLSLALIHIFEGKVYLIFSRCVWQHHQSPPLPPSPFHKHTQFIIFYFSFFKNKKIYEKLRVNVIFLKILLFTRTYTNGDCNLNSNSAART